MNKEPEFITRLKTESDELDEKLHILYEFMDTEKFMQITHRQAVLLTRQRSSMEDYLSTLNIRIKDLEENLKE